MSPIIIIRTIQDLERAPRLGGRYNLHRADLQGAILTGANLDGAILTRANLTNANLAGADLRGADLTGAILRNTIFFDDEQFADLDRARGGPNILNIIRTIERERERRQIETRELERTRRLSLPPILPSIPLEPWLADKECVGKEDPVTFDVIPEGRGFKLEDDKKNNLEYCYDVVTLAKIMRKNPTNARSPYTTIPFSTHDITRIKDYMKRYPIGGNKKKTHKRRKINKTRKSKKTNEKRKPTRRMK